MTHSHKNESLMMNLVLFLNQISSYNRTTNIKLSWKLDICHIMWNTLCIVRHETFRVWCHSSWLLWGFSWWKTPLLMIFHRDFNFGFCWLHYEPNVDHQMLCVCIIIWSHYIIITITTCLITIHSRPLTLILSTKSGRFNRCKQRLVVVSKKTLWL